MCHYNSSSAYRRMVREGQEIRVSGTYLYIYIYIYIYIYTRGWLNVHSLTYREFQDFKVFMMFVFV